MLSRNSVIGLAAVLVLLGSVVFIFRQCRGDYAAPIPAREWFYDLNKKELFAAPRGSLPPIAAPSGPMPVGSPAGVRAYVYGCGGCSDDQRYIGYLEILTPEDKQAQEEQQRQLTQLTPDGRAPVLTTDTQKGMQRPNLVKRPEDKEWVEIDSPEGQRIVQEALSRCGEKSAARPCLPSK